MVLMIPIRLPVWGAAGGMGLGAKSFSQCDTKTGTRDCYETVGLAEKFKAQIWSLLG